MEQKFSSVLLGLGVSAAILILIIWLLPDAKAVPREIAALPLSGPEQRFDFGEISMAKGPVTHDFALRRDDPEPVTITRISTSCMCTEARLITSQASWGPFGMPGHGRLPAIEATIPPGEPVTISVQFDPAAHGPSGIGRIERIVEIVDSAGRTSQLTIAALVTP